MNDLDQALSRINSYQEIRFFIAATPNFGHQASSINLLLRLAFDYVYSGLVTVVYDPGNETCRWTMPKLLRLLQGWTEPATTESLPQRLHNTRVQWLPTQDFAGSDCQTVELGMTGGAEMDRIYQSNLADLLNVRIALRLQPYGWPWCKDAIDFNSKSTWPSIDLLKDDYLGWRLFHRAYRLPNLKNCLGSSNGKQTEADGVMQSLLSLRAQDAGVSLSFVYGVRQKGVCSIDPANLLYVYFLSLLKASAEVHPVDDDARKKPQRQILIVNLDLFWGDAFSRLEAYLCSQFSTNNSSHLSMSTPCGPGEQQPASLPRVRNIADRVRCVSQFEDLLTAVEWLAKPLSHAPGTRPCATTSETDSLTLPISRVKLLYIHIGFISPRLFVDAVKQADLPIIFEGQHTASIVASLGRPYFKLRDSALNNSAQALRIPADTYRHGETINRIEAASLSLQLGALGERDLKESVECVSSIITDLMRPSSPVKAYIDDLGSYYRKPGTDKLEVCLAAWYKYGFSELPRREKETDVEEKGVDQGQHKKHISEARERVLHVSRRTKGLSIQQPQIQADGGSE